MNKALIFDLDGTIADTLPAISVALNRTMRRFGYPEHEIAALRGFINNGAAEAGHTCDAGKRAYRGAD